MALLPEWLRKFALSLTYGEIDMIETLRRQGRKPEEVLAEPRGRPASHDEETLRALKGTYMRVMAASWVRAYGGASDV